MKKTSKNQGSGARATSKVALTTAIAALPLAMGPTLHAQVPTTDQSTTVQPTRNASPALEVCCIKWAERYTEMEPSTIVGLDNGHTIYRNAKNEYFYLNPATGDMQFLAADIYLKFREPAAVSPSAVPLKMYKWSNLKRGEPVTILGMDRAGHVVQQNGRGEKFYLDPNTGDMVFVK